MSAETLSELSGHRFIAKSDDTRVTVWIDEEAGELCIGAGLTFGPRVRIPLALAADFEEQIDDVFRAWAQENLP